MKRNTISRCTSHALIRHIVNPFDHGRGNLQIESPFCTETFRSTVYIENFETADQICRVHGTGELYVLQGVDDEKLENGYFPK